MTATPRDDPGEDPLQPGRHGRLASLLPRAGHRPRSLADLVRSWPVVRQITAGDPLGRGISARSPQLDRTVARTAKADAVVPSVCPYCAVGCGQRVYVQDGRVTQIEGDPDSPISRGRLCPKGSASQQLVTSPTRQTHVRYRRAHGTEWEDLDLDTAMDMIADRMLATRRETWQDTDEEGRVLRRTMGISHLGGATLDNEENYLLKKLYTAMGAIQVENQARI
jgi:formate dehydrogenase major subunit